MDFLSSLKDAWDEAPLELAPEDQTVSPHLNSLIRAVRAHQQGLVPPEDVQREIHGLAARLERSSLDHGALYGSQDLPQEIQVLAGHSRASFQLFADGLRLLGEALEEGGSPEPGLDLCKQAAGGLDQQRQGFAEIQRRDSLAHCLMCDHPNQEQARACARCGAVLPRQMERSAAGGEVGAEGMVMVPPEYLELYRACDAVAVGALEVSEWRRAVDAMWGSFEQTRRFVETHLADHSQDLEGAPELRPVADSLLAGLAQAGAGLEHMARFEEDSDPQHLNQGWMTLLKGTRQVQDAGAIFLSTLQALQRTAQETAAAEPSSDDQEGQ